MHTGDNMLAIYASEKALRLAERLGEAAAASRAHGIFGRVFGRIGDSERARENLERSVELARETDPAEAVRALLALGYHLEISEADYEGASGAYGEALAIALRTGDLPSQVELHAALAQLAAYRGDWETASRGGRRLADARRARGPDRQALLPVLDARRPARRTRATSTRRSSCSGEPPSSAEQVGRSEVAFESLHGSAARCASAAITPTPTRRWRGRSTSASAPAWSPSRSRRPRRERSTSRPGASSTRRARRPTRPPASPSGCATRSAWPRASRRAGPPTGRRARCSSEAREAWDALGRPRDAERCETPHLRTAALEQRAASAR